MDQPPSNYSTGDEQARRQAFVQLIRECPIPDNQLLSNLGLFMNRQLLSRLMFIQHLYQQILPVHGIIVEFGVRWGQNLATFTALRGMLEPFNFNRKIVGFDTFAGFPSTTAQDGQSDLAEQGNYNVTPGYQDYLQRVLEYHEQECPVSHIRKFELIAGDACETLPAYLDAHPETIIALAYFDFDIYEPTKRCLECIRDRVTKDSVIAFDELNCSEFPGETLALKEVFGLDHFALKRTPHNPTPSYAIVT